MNTTTSPGMEGDGIQSGHGLFRDAAVIDQGEASGGGTEPDVIGAGGKALGGAERVGVVERATGIVEKQRNAIFRSIGKGLPVG